MCKARMKFAGTKYLRKEGMVNKSTPASVVPTGKKACTKISVGYRTVGHSIHYSLPRMKLYCAS